jgi:hypothetical protein
MNSPSSVPPLESFVPKKARKSYAHSENTDPLGQARDIGLCPENAFEFAVAKPWIGRRPHPMAEDSPIQAISLLRHQRNFGDKIRESRPYLCPEVFWTDFSRVFAWQVILRTIRWLRNAAPNVKQVESNNSHLRSEMSNSLVRLSWCKSVLLPGKTTLT